MHITKKKRDAIVKLHRQGESIELLTAISGLNRTTITSIIKKDDSEKLFREFNRYFITSDELCKFLPDQKYLSTLKR